jgi:hypothetical protein
MAINGITASVLASKYNRGDAADVQKYINSEGITQADVKAYFPDFDLSSLKGITVPTTAANTSNALTTDVARDLMQRSMTTGAPTSEFDKYGGYNAVAAKYAQSGGQLDTSSISAADKAKYANTIANTGVGNLSLLKETNTPLTAAGRAAMIANGITTMDAAALTNSGIPFQKNTDEKLSDLSSQYSTLNNNYSTLNSNYSALSTQLTALQKAYEDLAKKKTTGTTGTTGNVTSGGTTVDTGGTNIDTSNAGGATTGPVYGPDGRMYSSAASAIAAGVTNYTRTKPTGILAGVDTLGAGGGGTASRGFMSDAVNSGNVNPGGLISGQSKQLFNPAININLPGGLKNPYSV